MRDTPRPAPRHASDRGRGAGDSIRAGNAGPSFCCRPPAVSRLSRPGPTTRQAAEDLFLQRLPALVVLLRDVGHGLERVDADDVLELVAQVALLAREQLDALVEVATDELLQAAAVAADHLREEVTAHERLAGALLLGDHLQQDAARDVLLVLRSSTTKSTRSTTSRRMSARVT